MAIDPRSLESIRNPLAGLSNIGAMYAKGVEMRGRKDDREFRQTQITQDSLMRKNIQDVQMADTASKISGAYAKSAIEWKSLNPDTSNEDFQSFQLEEWNSLDPAYQQFVPKKFQSLSQLQSGLKQSENIQNALHPTKPTKKGKDDSGMLVKKGKDGTFEVVDSATRSIDNTITADNLKDISGLMFIRSDSPLSAKMKAQSKGGDPEKIAKPFEKAQILQAETITQRSLDSDKFMQNNNLLKEAAEFFEGGGGTFRGLSAAIQDVVSSIPGFEGLDDMAHAERELFFKTAMQSGINKAIEQKGNLNPQEFKAGLSTAIKKSDSAMGIKLASNAFNELARQDKIVMQKMNAWNRNPENTNRIKSDLRGFDQYMQNWVREHPPIISQSKEGKKSYLYYSQSKDAHSSKTDGLIKAYADSEAKKGNKVSEAELAALKAGAMKNFDNEWANIAVSSRW